MQAQVKVLWMPERKEGVVWLLIYLISVLRVEASCLSPGFKLSEREPALSHSHVAPDSTLLTLG